VPEGNYSPIIAGFLLAGWVLRGCGQWQFGQARALMNCLFVFWGITLVSTLQAADGDVAWSFFEQLSKILLPLVAGVTLIDTTAKLKQLVWVIVLSQGLVAYEMNASYFAGYNRLFHEGFATLDNNTAAITMVVGAGVAFFLMLHEKSWLRKFVALGLMALMTHAVMISFSRGGLLSLFVSGATAFFILPKRALYIAVFLGVALMGARMAGPEVLARFATIFVREEQRDYSATSRIDLWKACLEEMAANPITGIGPDHWKLVAHQHGFPNGKAAHSTWMQTAAECGVIGLTSLAMFYLLCIHRLWRLAGAPRDIATSADLDLQAVARMVVCSLTGFVVGAQFVSVGLVEIPYYVAAAGIGALKLASLPGEEAPPA
jgi:probable O-glycosylation ligase (exosortase A-associated)